MLARKLSKGGGETTISSWSLVDVIDGSNSLTIPSSVQVYDIGILVCEGKNGSWPSGWETIYSVSNFGYDNIDMGVFYKILSNDDANTSVSVQSEANIMGVLRPNGLIQKLPMISDISTTTYSGQDEIPWTAKEITAEEPPYLAIGTYMGRQSDLSGRDDPLTSGVGLIDHYESQSGLGGKLDWAHLFVWEFDSNSTPSTLGFQSYYPYDSSNRVDAIVLGVKLLF